MKRIFLIGIVLLAAFSIYWLVIHNKKPRIKEAKQGPLALKTHTSHFNSSIDNIMQSYHQVKNAFVDGDTARVKENTVTFVSLLDSIPLSELKSDTAMIFESASETIADLRRNAQSLLEQNNITEMRKDFSMVTEMLYPAFFKTINYEGEKLYLQHCPMAFNGDQGANWISNELEIVNPYLGKNHPKYKGTMLHCGEIKDTIKAQ
jgi:hypothetical protein